MYILTQYGTQIIASEHVERFAISRMPDCDRIVASYAVDDRSCVTIARYAKSEDAQGVLYDLLQALACGMSTYTMPLSILQAGEEHKHDARTKRKGGS